VATHGRSAPDVVVVGGGIVGAATAAFLAAAGADVLLVERDGIAAAASGRNSGVVQYPLDPVLASLHRETVGCYRELGASSTLFALPARPAGLLYVSRQPAVAAALAAELAASHPELAPAYLDGPALRRLEPTLDPAVAACRLEIGFPVAPGAATRAYAAAAERAGARIRLGGAAALVVDRDAGTGVRLGDEVVTAGAVVIAAGPWTPDLIDPSGRWRPIRALWGVVTEVELADPPRHVLEEAAIDETIEPGDARAGKRGVRPTPADEPNPGGSIAFSLVTAAGRSVLGSTFFDAEPDAESFVPAIRERGARFVPAIADAPVSAARRCARPLSVDGRPLVGAVPWLDRVFVAAGHGPWGISTGPATARMVADAVLGRDAGIPDALDPGRFSAP